MYRSQTNSSWYSSPAIDKIGIKITQAEELRKRHFVGVVHVNAGPFQKLPNIHTVSNRETDDPGDVARQPADRFVVGKRSQPNRIVRRCQDSSDGASKLVGCAEGQTSTTASSSEQIR